MSSESETEREMSFERGIKAESYVRCLHPSCMIGARGGIMKELTKKANHREKYRQYGCECGNIVELKMNFTNE
jgi:hypothetical protein